MKNEHILARPGDGFTAMSKQPHTLAKGTRDAVEEEAFSSLVGGGISNRWPVGRLHFPESSQYTKLILYPLKPWPELLRGWVASNCDGQTSLRVSLELLSIKESLTTLKGEVDMGIERLEVVLKSLEPTRSSMNSMDKQALGCKGKDMVVEVGDGPLQTNGSYGFKPKKNK